MIKKCTCSNNYQDVTHGKDNRVMNKLKSNEVKCTVCSKKHILKLK